MPMRPTSVPFNQVAMLAGFNPRRTALSIFNNGTETIFISNDQVNILSNGFPLPTGTAYHFTKQSGDAPSEAVYAISQTIANDVRLYEGFSDEESS